MQPPKPPAEDAPSQPNVCVHVRADVCARVRAHPLVCTRMYTSCVHVCMHPFMRIPSFMRTLTHTRTHTCAQDGGAKASESVWFKMREARRKAQEEMLKHQQMEA